MDELPNGTVTLLFTDIDESTHLLQREGEDKTNMLETCRLLLRTMFQQFHGHEVDSQGNTFFVAFARAIDAITAAVAAQRALMTHARTHDMSVRVRMILHTGELQLAAESYVSLDIQHNMRFMEPEHGCQILLSQTTRDLVEHKLPRDVNLRDLGIYRLKEPGISNSPLPNGHKGSCR